MRLIEADKKQDKLKKVHDYMLSIGLKPNDLDALKIKKPTMKYQYKDENNKQLTCSGWGEMPFWLTKFNIFHSVITITTVQICSEF